MRWHMRVGVACFLAITAITSLALGRTWKSADGKYSIDAELVSKTDTAVTLKKTNGQVITVPLGVLSEADRAFLKSQAEPDGEASEDNGDAAREVLESAGLTVLRASLKLPEEDKFENGMKETTRTRVELKKAARVVELAKQQIAVNQQRITHLTQLNVQLSARLATINKRDVTTNNKIVGALQANDGQRRLLEQAGEKMVEQERAARGAYNDAREKYVQQILDLRKLANAVQMQYAQLSANAEMRQAVADLNAATEKSYELATGRTFNSAERRLKALEDTVLSESIPLRRDRGDTFWVSVVVNGEKTREMVLDSGASLTIFPANMARELGIKIGGSQDKRIVLVLADGGQIEATEVTVPSLRVGKFIVENVRCAVLDPEATQAAPLLGISFLREFRFEVDAQKSTLTMVKVEEG